MLELFERPIRTHHQRVREKEARQPANSNQGFNHHFDDKPTLYRLLHHHCPLTVESQPFGLSQPNFPQCSLISQICCWNQGSIVSHSNFEIGNQQNKKCLTRGSSSSNNNNNNNDDSNSKNDTNTSNNNNNTGNSNNKFAEKSYF